MTRSFSELLKNRSLPVMSNFNPTLLSLEQHPPVLQNTTLSYIFFVFILSPGLIGAPLFVFLRAQGPPMSLIGLTGHFVRPPRRVPAGPPRGTALSSACLAFAAPDNFKLPDIIFSSRSNI